MTVTRAVAVHMERELEAVFVSYALFGRWEGEQMGFPQKCGGLPGLKFLSLCREAGLVDDKLVTPRVIRDLFWMYKDMVRACRIAFVLTATTPVPDPRPPQLRALHTLSPGYRPVGIRRLCSGTVGAVATEQHEPRQDFGASNEAEQGALHSHSDWLRTQTHCPFDQRCRRNLRMVNFSRQHMRCLAFVCAGCMHGSNALSS